jgi:hypothetical protein
LNTLVLTNNESLIFSSYSSLDECALDIFELVKNHTLTNEWNPKTLQVDIFDYDQVTALKILEILESRD